MVINNLLSEFENYSYPSALPIFSFCFFILTPEESMGGNAWAHKRWEIELRVSQ